MNSSSVSLNTSFLFFSKSFFELTKARLAISVVFSSVVGYLLAVDSFDLYTLILLSIGGYCMVGASNSFNQIIEKDIDVLMDRTKNRPIPSKKMSVSTAFYISIILTLIGIVVLYK
ncbi:UbiA family prenyltransferase, partial [Flavobacteriaceae bacterium]|nr:UbiA family prenyltransferase [Flavobacteriaceae bacterium]